MKKHIKIYTEAINSTFIPCELCGATATDVHHIKYKSRGGKDELSNLMGLCRNCHNKAHNEIIKEYELLRIHDAYLRNKAIIS